MEIIYKDIDDLVPYEKNPRINEQSVEYVANSIKEFGFKIPMIIDKNDVIVAGHTRYKASQRLGLKKVPCIIADDLTDEQIKAFRIADNKVGEFSEWDMDFLTEELEEIENIDMEEFGLDLDFDMPSIEGDTEPKVNERDRTINSYNLELFDPSKCEGKYQMPIIENDGFIPKDIIGFNYAKTSDKKNVGIHFYLDDYQFERLWNNPYDYVEMLGEYSCILSPDFSLYMDMPMSMKIWNVYRSRLIGQYYQDCGIKVIPTISWAEKETFEFCFDGIPEGSIVSVSTIGVKRSDDAYTIWKDGMDEMIKRIKPKTILVYGGEIEYDYGDIEVIYFDNKVTERMKRNGDN